MNGPDSDRTESGFKVRTPVDEARQIFREAVDAQPEQGADSTAGAAGLPATGTETIDLERADGRVLAAPITAAQNVPHYERAAMDATPSAPKRRSAQVPGHQNYFE